MKTAFDKPKPRPVYYGALSPNNALLWMLLDILTKKGIITDTEADEYYWEHKGRE